MAFVLNFKFIHLQIHDFFAESLMKETVNVLILMILYLSLTYFILTLFCIILLSRFRGLTLFGRLKLRSPKAINCHFVDSIALIFLVIC